LRGSPGFEPRRSVGVSPIATMAALPRMLIGFADLIQVQI
jgi:hypothetical protein